MDRRYERMIRESMPKPLAERAINQAKRNEWYIKNKTEPVTGYKLRNFEAVREYKIEEQRHLANELKLNEPNNQPKN